MSEARSKEGRFYLANVYDWWELFWPPLATWGDLRGAANDA